MKAAVFSSAGREVFEFDQFSGLNTGNHIGGSTDTGQIRVTDSEVIVHGPGNVVLTAEGSGDWVEVNEIEKYRTASSARYQALANEDEGRTRRTVELHRRFSTGILCTASHVDGVTLYWFGSVWIFVVEYASRLWDGCAVQIRRGFVGGVRSAPARQRVVGSHMDYVATEFLPLSDLPAATADLIRAHLGAASDAAWEQLITEHNDRAAALLAVCGALSKTLLRLDDGRSVSGLELVSEINLLAGDRAYMLLDRGAFGSWREGGGQFAITRADGSVESGKVGFNRGGTGGSLHEGFDIQGITGNRDVPRIQWNYRHCDGLADIDVDGYQPWDFFHHLTYANSDVRQWYAKYVSKFGQAPFKVKKIGGVEPDKVTTTSQCPLPHDRLTDDERARAVAQALAFSSLLESSGDFRAAVDGAADRRLFVDVLRSPRMSPLIGMVAPAVLEQAPAEALRDYYLARANVQLSQIDASEGLRQAMRSRRDSTADTALGALAEAVDSSASSLAEPVESVDQLARARHSLRADEQSGAAVRLEASRFRTRSAAEREPAVWLTSDPHARADPRLVRTVAVELPKVRLILAPDGADFRVVSAVPWASGLNPD